MEQSNAQEKTNNGRAQKKANSNFNKLKDLMIALKNMVRQVKGKDCENGKMQRGRERKRSNYVK